MTLEKTFQRTAEEVAYGGTWSSLISHLADLAVIKQRTISVKKFSEKKHRNALIVCVDLEFWGERQVVQIFSSLINQKFGTYRDRMNNYFKLYFSVDGNNLLQVPLFGVWRKDVYVTWTKPIKWGKVCYRKIDMIWLLLTNRVYLKHNNCLFFYIWKSEKI